MKELVSNTGIVIRQALDPDSEILTNCPDLIITGTEAAFDPASFIDPTGYKWYFSNAPVIGSANYLYVRGLNYNPRGTQNSRVYLYYAQSDQVLDPTKWQSSGFTVGGASQNYTPIDAVSQYQYVYTTTPVLWMPPQPSTSGATYYLISWIDNSGNPVAPTWPTTPFADMAALALYIESNPQMAVLDTIYRGAFLRQFPGQTVEQDGTGAQTSPDVLVFGPVAAQDAAAWTTQASYGSGTLTQTASYATRNFVYLRALNTTAGPARARVYLYWATTTALAPTAWQSTGFTYAGQSQNWVDLSASAAGQVMVSTVPIVWNAPNPLPATYVLIAYVDNSPEPQPPSFSPFGYLNVNYIAKFVASHPQLSWLGVTGSVAKPYTMSWETPVAVGTGPSDLYVGIQLSGVPTDGTLALSIPGPDGGNTVAVASMTVPDPDALIAWPVTYPEQFRTSAVLTYTAGVTPPGAASIVATVVPRPPPSMIALTTAARARPGK